MSRVVQWIEVWIDDASRGEYLLVLRGFSDGILEVIDPQKGGERVATFHAYEEATAWLNEDEYDLVEGRYLPRP